MRRLVQRDQAQNDPYLVWNTFVELIATEDYASLTPLQQKAHLVFWYDSEIQNGGHGQYFENRGIELVPDTVIALTALGLPNHANLLSRALAVLSPGGPEVDWAVVLSDDLIHALDTAFHDCTPTIQTALERHLCAHTEEYVKWT